MVKISLGYWPGIFLGLLCGTLLFIATVKLTQLW
jgi:hypothetical protein